MEQISLSQRNTRTAMILLGVLGLLVVVTVVSVIVLN
jgi:predicted nucleic acid-binding Zn ribbon protein